jgi:hypothetical protein
MPRSTGSSVVALVAGRYELVRELRAESDTVEWEAFDSALERQVLVQLLRPELAHDTVAIDRFWQQARAAARRTAAVGDRLLDGGTDPETGQLFVVREWPAAAPLAAVGPRFVPREPAAMARVRRRFEDRPRWLIVSGGVIVLILVAAVVRPGVEGWLAWVNSPLARSNQSLGLAPAVAVPGSGAQPGQSTSTPAPAPPTIAPAQRSAPSAPTAAAASPTRAATATALATGGQARRVVNTDGRGVALRATPGGDRLPAKGYDEGVTVQALEQSGEWTRIRGSDGREGWVLTVTLAP